MDHKQSRRKRSVKPLDSEALQELALAYVARFSTTSARLETYLKRKLRERGWAGEGAPDPAMLVADFVARGFVDDEAFARARSGSLLRRGYGALRVREALGAAGVAPEIGETCRPDRGAERRAALVLARKRRFGPFASAPADRVLHEKQLAAMLRSGHPFEIARQILAAVSVEEAEAWVAEAEQEDI